MCGGEAGVVETGDRDVVRHALARTFTLTANLWWGTNATGYRFSEGDTLLAEGTLVAATPQAQLAKLAVTGASIGQHSYRVEFTNAAGSTTSAPLTVTVRG